MKVIRRTALVAAAAAVTLTLAACSSSTGAATSAPSTAASEAAATPAAGGTIVDIASTSEGFGTLVAAVKAAGLVDTLNGPGPFTVFAPTDAAFAALPAGLLKPENKELLAKILTYHVVSGKILAADVTDGDVATVEGQSIKISTMDGVTVNGAKVVTVDVVTDNGVIHAIDAVILPPDVDAAALLAK